MAGRATLETVSEILCCGARTLRLIRKYPPPTDQRSSARHQDTSTSPAHLRRTKQPAHMEYGCNRREKRSSPVPYVVPLTAWIARSGHMGGGSSFVHSWCSWCFSFMGLPQAQRSPLFFSPPRVVELTPHMLHEEGPIPQRHLKLEEFQTSSRYLVGYLYHQLLERRQIQPGKRAVNIAALMSRFPQIIITNEYGARVTTEPSQTVPTDDFATMQKIPSDDEVAALHRQGFQQAARARCLAHRVAYRMLMRLYVSHTSEVFLRRLCASIESGQKKTDGRNNRRYGEDTSQHHQTKISCNRTPTPLAHSRSVRLGQQWNAGDCISAERTSVVTFPMEVALSPELLCYSSKISKYPSPQ